MFDMFEQQRCDHVGSCISHRGQYRWLLELQHMSVHTNVSHATQHIYICTHKRVTHHPGGQTSHLQGRVYIVTCLQQTRHMILNLALLTTTSNSAHLEKQIKRGCPDFRLTTCAPTPAKCSTLPSSWRQPASTTGGRRLAPSPIP